MCTDPICKTEKAEDKKWKYVLVGALGIITLSSGLINYLVMSTIDNISETSDAQIVLKAEVNTKLEYITRDIGSIQVSIQRLENIMLQPTDRR